MFDVNIMDALSEGGLNFRAYSSGYWPWKKKKNLLVIAFVEWILDAMLWMLYNL